MAGAAESPRRWRRRHALKLARVAHATRNFRRNEESGHEIARAMEDSVAAAAALGEGAAPRCAFVDGCNVPGGRPFEVVRGHHGMRELAALVRRNVGARARRKGEDNRRNDGAHGNHLPQAILQLSIAPAAAHAFICETACAFCGPKGGMFPPYQERQELLELVRGGLEPVIWPLPWRYEYIPFGVLVPAWQPVQLPGVPAFR
jgi:hypothetical protein